MKRFWICAILALLLLCGIGYFEIFGLPANFPANLLRYALLGVSGAFLLSIFFSGMRRDVSFLEGRNLFGAVCAALLGAGIVLRSIYNIYSLYLYKSTDSFGTLFENHPGWGLLEPILGLLAAVVLFAAAVSSFMGFSFFAKLPAIAAIVPVWYCCGVVLHFVSKIATASTAENSVEVLAVVFALLFFFERAKVCAGVDSERASKRTMQCGMIAFVFLIASTLQYAAELYFKGSTHSSFELPTHLLNAVLALYILSQLLFLRSVKTPLPGEETEAGAPAEAPDAGGEGEA